MMELYSLKDCERSRLRAGRSLWAALGCFAAAMIVCVILCVNVTTLNARAFYIAVAAVSTLGGWAAMLIWALAYAPRRAAFNHMKGMLEGRREEYTGILGRPGEVSHIPGAIDVRRVPLTTDEGSVSLLVYAPNAGSLPDEDARVRVETVSRYVISWEVIV